MSTKDSVVLAQAIDRHAPADSTPGMPLEAIAYAPPAPNLSSAVLRSLIGLALAVLAVALIMAIAPRVGRAATLRAEATRIKSRIPLVTVAKPLRPLSTSDTLLPGTVDALQETTIYARTNGYLKRWHVDIGDIVKEGQLLAEIETPELDQELRQARATIVQLRARLGTAEANAVLGDSSFQRYKSAAARGGISVQELAERQATLDTSRSIVQAAKADIAAGEANLARLTELKAFANVYAPFPGTVTQRQVDVGALVTAGNTASQALFKIAETDVVRVFVNVPQVFAPSVATGQEARLFLRELPGTELVGKVTRTAGALDRAARSLLTQIEVPNPDRRLLPGMYVQVQLPLKRDQAPFMVPASALVFSGDGTQLALVRGGRVHFQRVVIERDDGAALAIGSGLTGEEQVIANPSERLVEGLAVRVASKGASDAKGGS